MNYLGSLIDGENTYESRKSQPRSIRLSQEAYRLWKAYQRETELSMRPEYRFEHGTDWAGKLPGNVARIAGILHIVEHSNDIPDKVAISLSNMEKAISLGRALSDYALIAYDFMITPDNIKDAIKILDWIKQKSITTLSARDAQVRFKGKYDKKMLTPMFEGLEDNYYTRGIPKTAGIIGRQGDMYHVNPGVLTLTSI